VCVRHAVVEHLLERDDLDSQRKALPGLASRLALVRLGRDVLACQQAVVFTPLAVKWHVPQR
jgi:hypothetical protein